MTDSSLSLTAGGFYPIVSGCRDGCATADYLLQPQECVERCLEKRVGRYKLQRQDEKTYCEMSDLTVYCLLLGYLPHSQ